MDPALPRNLLALGRGCHHNIVAALRCIAISVLSTRPGWRRYAPPSSRVWDSQRWKRELSTLWRISRSTDLCFKLKATVYSRLNWRFGEAKCSHNRDYSLSFRWTLSGKMPIQMKLVLWLNVVFTTASSYQIFDYNWKLNLKIAIL